MEEEGIDLSKLKEWDKRQKDKDINNIWVWIVILAFVSGIFVSSQYWSGRANDAIQEHIDEINEQKIQQGFNIYFNDTGDECVCNPTLDIEGFLPE